MAIALRPSAVLSATERTAPRHRVAIPARLTWKDSGGAIRFASVVTRDVSDGGAFVECASQTPIPLFRLVHLQLETTDPSFTTKLNGDRILAAVWRVESPTSRIGSPSGYALRFLVDPAMQATRHQAPGIRESTMAVAS